MNRFNLPKVKEKLETEFPAWLKNVQILSAQIASSEIGMDYWKKEAEQAKQSSRKANRQMEDMREKQLDVLAQLNNLRQYVKHMPEEVQEKYHSTRKEALRILHGDFDR